MTNPNLPLSFASRNIPVFPCSAENKRPLTPNGFRGATTSERIIRIWCERYPGCLWAMPTGARTGCWVLDVDAKHGAAPADLPHALPATRTVRTRTGGWHFYWTFSGQTNRTGDLPTGFDVRGQGGLVILPGNPGYEMVDDSPVIDAPEWLLDMIKPKPYIPIAGVPYRADTHDAYVDAAVTAELAILAGTGPGSRGWQLNASSYLIGQFVGAGALSESEAEHAVWDAACRCGIVQVDGPVSVRRTIQRSIKQGAQRPRALPEREIDNTRRVDVAKLIANSRRNAAT